MRIDWYTKAVLTIIAAALVWIAADGPSLLPAVEAQAGPQRVVIVGTDFGGLPSPALPVQIAGWVDTSGIAYRLPGPVQRERPLSVGMGVPTTTDAGGTNRLP